MGDPRPIPCLRVEVEYAFGILETAKRVVQQKLPAGGKTYNFIIPAEGLEKTFVYLYTKSFFFFF